MKKVIVIISMILFVNCSNRDTIVDKNDLLGKDYRLFQNTPAWTLAKAVEDEDLNKIREEVIKNKSIINFQEPRFGGSLLMFTIYNNQYKSCEELLKLGANPNLKDNYRGSNAVICAADNEDPKYLKLILSYKGDPNSLETAPTTDGDQARKTPLNVAISYNRNNLEKVKLLVEAGADINYFNEGPKVYTRLPLADAITVEKADIILYLLQKGADYKKVIYTRIDGTQIYILEALRQCLIDLDSEQYNYKSKVIEFLKEKGLDYKNEPVPNYVLKEIKIKHPNDWEEYLEKY